MKDNFMANYCHGHTFLEDAFFKRHEEAQTSLSL